MSYKHKYRKDTSLLPLLGEEKNILNYCAWGYVLIN